MNKPELNNKPAKPAAFLGLTWSRFRSILAESTASISSYRDLSVEPMKRVFAYLLVLVLAVSVLLTARDLFRVYRYLAEVSAMLIGNIPAVTIEEGEIACARNPFEFRRDDPFSAGTYRDRLSLYASNLEEAFQRLENEETADVGENLSVLEGTLIAVQSARDWSETVFPEAGEELDRTRVASAVSAAEEAGKLSPEAAEQANLLGEDGFVFRIDLENEEPGFAAPFVEGFFLTKDKILFRPPFFPQPFDLLSALQDKETRTIDDEFLPRLPKLVVWAVAPPALVIQFVRYLVLRLIQALIGCLAGAAVAGFYRIRLPFRRLFAVSVFALTAPIILGLALDISGIRLPAQEAVVVGMYLAYCGLAARSCSTLR